ncbi:MAG TPA: cob(I)yrinic acid a,c-diamide adenosyltransferase [Myxococcales bacterium]|nr:cob(I)yrinic acid a,c-diamide adenosyltransferase [Myxococcales bacterium]
MKVYTKRGDGGETDLAGGGRVAKDDLRVEAYGAVDELNSFVGLALLDCVEDLRPALEAVQRTLFEIGAALATNPEASSSASSPALSGAGASEADVASLEAAIDAADAELAPLRAFVLPGGTRAAAAFHAARTVCRRAERRAVALNRSEEVEASNLRYLNRLSDTCFVWARLENARAGLADIEWTRRGG